MKSLLLKVVLFFATLNLFGNVGIFSGSGINLVLSKTENIQMQSEVVKITPHANDGLIDMNGKNRLWADYRCEFTLINLTDKATKVKVAFPLSGDDRSANYEAIKNRDFKAISRSQEVKDLVHHKVEYIPRSKENIFGHIFEWEMEFRPNETRKLDLSYKLAGYIGIGTTKLSRKQRSDFYIGENLTYGFSQAFGYVTKTATSWAGEIESAEFIFDLREIENALNKGDVFDFGRLADKEEHIASLIPNGQWTRFLNPVFKEQEEGIYVAKFSPFTPTENFNLIYHLSVLPKDIEGLEKLMNFIEHIYKKTNERDALRAEAKGEIFEPKVLSEKDKRNLACLILNFYGIEIENEEIQEFIENQHYYKAQYYPKIDNALKEKLLEMSKK